MEKLFWLKVYDLTITNVDLLVNSSNRKASDVPRIFEEYSTNFCFKNIPKIFPEYCKVMKIFL